MAIIISYPTSASGIIVLLKTPLKYREFFPTLFVKTTDFQLVFNFEQTRTVTIFGESSRIALSNDSVFNDESYCRKMSMSSRRCFYLTPQKHFLSELYFKFRA